MYINSVSSYSVTLALRHYPVAHAYLAAHNAVMLLREPLSIDAVDRVLAAHPQLRPFVETRGHGKYTKDDLAKEAYRHYCNILQQTRFQSRNSKVLYYFFHQRKSLSQISDLLRMPADRVLEEIYACMGLIEGYSAFHVPAGFKQAARAHAYKTIKELQGREVPALFQGHKRAPDPPEPAPPVQRNKYVK